MKTVIEADEQMLREIISQTRRDDIEESIMSAFSNIEISREAAAEILKKSKATMQRYVAAKKLRPINPQERINKFDLRYILEFKRKELSNLNK